jgi:release factor glutamine methyltransferase
VTVYTPGEDTYLVLENLEGLDLEGKKFLDMGTGNGEIALKAVEKGAKVTAIDVNPEALDYAEDKAKERGLEDEISFVESDLFENVEGDFDVVVFNPPYLPGEQGLGDEEIWRGGEKGIEVTEKFLEEVADYLRPDGFALVVVSSRADIDGLLDGFDLVSVDEKSLWFEDLKLLRFD